MKPIFLYGTLRDRALLATVLGRTLGADECQPASARNHVAMRVAGHAYPTLVAAPGAVAEGLMFRPASQQDRDRVCFYEEAEYGLAPIVLHSAEGAVEAEYFRSTGRLRPEAAAWNFECWAAEHRGVALEAARELMDHYGHLATEDINTLWPGMVTRARARARAQRQPMPPALGGAFTREADVVVERHSRSWTGHLAVEEQIFRHRRHDGDWTGPLARTSVSWGDAVTILPYDPHRDRVLLIQQFRPGPAARLDPSPWCIEVVAGRIDAEEGAETTARREAREEAGLDIGRVIELPGYYPSPGLSSEYLSCFVGEAELAHEGGLHGAPSEGEDIRTLVLALDDALDALERGAINTGPAMLPLLWLARHREHVRAEWAEVEPLRSTGRG